MPEIDLRPFCYKGELRPVLRQPFSRGRWTYATDGGILIRVPRRDDVPEDPVAPHAERIIDPIPLAAELQSLPSFDFPEPQKITCPKCDGSGRKHECPDCNCECMRCDGKGFEEKVITGGIGNAVYQARYLKLLATLPSVLVPASPPPGREPMRFTFEGGGEGLLMGYAGPGKVHITPTRTEPG